MSKKATNRERIAQLRLAIRREDNKKKGIPTITVQFPEEGSSAQLLNKEIEIIRSVSVFDKGASGLIWTGKSFSTSRPSHDYSHILFARNIPFEWQQSALADLDIQLELEDRIPIIKKRLEEKYEDIAFLRERVSDTVLLPDEAFQQQFTPYEGKPAPGKSKKNTQVKKKSRRGGSAASLRGIR